MSSNKEKTWTGPFHNSQEAFMILNCTQKTIQDKLGFSYGLEVFKKEDAQHLIEMYDLFEPKKEIQKEFYEEIPVAINVNGGYHDVGAFFDRIANLSRIVNIKDIRMAPAGGGRLKTSCTAVTYKFRKEQPADKKKGKPRGKRKRR